MDSKCCSQGTAIEVCEKRDNETVRNIMGDISLTMIDVRGKAYSLKEIINGPENQGDCKKDAPIASMMDALKEIRGIAREVNDVLAISLNKL